MKSLGRLVHNLTQQLKPRTGKMERKQFSPQSPESPIASASMVTNDIHQGDIHVSHQESAKVRFANGNSLSSDGKTVSVRDDDGKLVREFSGSVEVTEKAVTVQTPDRQNQQIFGASGSNVFFDNGRIVQMEGDTAFSLLPNAGREEGKVDGTGVSFAGGETASPIFNQEWLMSK